jgi:hypothetical protein
MVMWVIALQILSILLAGSVGEAKEPEVTHGNLEVQIEMNRGQHTAGIATVKNVGTQEVLVWRTGNSWGDSTLSFVAISQGREAKITRKPQTYTRNVPATTRIASNGVCKIPFNLDDGSWEPTAAIEKLREPGVQLRATYRIESSSEAETNHVWVGDTQSKPILLQ